MNVMLQLRDGKESSSTLLLRRNGRQTIETGVNGMNDKTVQVMYRRTTGHQYNISQLLERPDINQHQSRQSTGHASPASRSIFEDPSRSRLLCYGNPCQCLRLPSARQPVSGSRGRESKTRRGSAECIHSLDSVRWLLLKQ